MLPFREFGRRYTDSLTLLLCSLCFGFKLLVARYDSIVCSRLLVCLHGSTRSILHQRSSLVTRASFALLVTLFPARTRSEKRTLGNCAIERSKRRDLNNAMPYLRRAIWSHYDIKSCCSYYQPPIIPALLSVFLSTANFMCLLSSSTLRNWR